VRGVLWPVRAPVKRGIEEKRLRGEKSSWHRHERFERTKGQVRKTRMLWTLRS